MLGTLIRRVTVRTLDAAVRRGRDSSRAPLRVAATALDRARTLVGLDVVQRQQSLPDWSGEHPQRPMWESDRKKLAKFRVDHGIDKAPDEDGDEAKVESVAVVEIYYKRGCPYARAALDLLREREIEFAEVDFKGDEATASWLKIQTGRKTSPQIFIHGESVGGFDELRALDQSGELTRRIEGGAARDEVSEPAADSGDADEMDVADLRERLDDGAEVLLLDVRNAAEVERGIIEHAVHIPLAELAERHTELDAGAVWIAYCKSGKRSSNAVAQLRGLGFRSVVNLRGGIDAWSAAGGATVSPHRSEPRRRVSLPVVHPERSPFEGLDDPWDGLPTETLEGTELVDRVKEVLDECRPLVQADGGDIELLDVQGDIVHVQLTGNCIGCPSSQATLRQGIERRLQTRIPQIKGIASPQLGPQ